MTARLTWLSVIVILILTAGCSNPPVEKPAPVEVPVVIDDSQLIPGSQPWLLIDSKTETLTVYQLGEAVARFENLAFGSRGAGPKQRRGDRVTPTGQFRVGWFNPYSRFRYFIGLDYPNLDHARTAYQEQRIDERTYQRIVKALADGKTPPQNTPLGGQIGIHGVGAGDPWVHENFDWTQGCIALSNRQIDQLRPWVKQGTPVLIR